MFNSWNGEPEFADDVICFYRLSQSHGSKIPTEQTEEANTWQKETKTSIAW